MYKTGHIKRMRQEKGIGACDALRFTAWSSYREQPFTRLLLCSWFCFKLRHQHCPNLLFTNGNISQSEFSHFHLTALLLSLMWTLPVNTINQGTISNMGVLEESHDYWAAFQKSSCYVSRGLGFEVTLNFSVALTLGVMDGNKFST